MVELHEISEGASTSSSTHRRGYDVFLSFRGLDTRNSFTNHLYNALMNANINTFLDDEEIEIGDDLKPELESAIKASRAYVIVLSKNYASSRWCLDELVLILEQRKTSNRIVIPIFYHVEPTHVRKQQSSFGDAMAEHRQRMEAETDANKRNKLAQKIDGWNKALTEVADLKGKDANGRLEVELIDEIVNHIFRRLHIPSRFPLPQLIGMDDSIEFVTSWLNDASSHTTDILTIWGLGGIGKTSLAKYVYASHSHEFDTSSFIKDIDRRINAKYNGMLDVQKQLHDSISKPSSLQLDDDSIYTSMIENIVARKKVFLVLDDIGSLDQLDALLGSNGFHPGSKIIITTKDASLTESSELFKLNGKLRHTKHLLEGLSLTESQKLLCFHAFTHNDPKVGYEVVSGKLVEYCQGHPMAIKVLGRSLHNRDVTYWEGYIHRLKKEHDSPVNNVLRMSYNSLPLENDKELFKHIACFFVGKDKDVTLTILEACDKETRIGITNLIDKYLLSIGYDNELMMHQLVQEMGRLLVHEESLDKPWERSRLWGYDSFNVLKQKKGTGNVLGLGLDMRMFEKEKLHVSLKLTTEALSKMDNLMLLQLNYVPITGPYKNFPEKLRWLCMHGFLLKSIPSDLPLKSLVALEMSYSNITSFGIFYSYPQRLHKGIKQLLGSCSKEKRLLGSLKILNLSFCEQLCSLSGFVQFPALERLILTNCTRLLEVCESIEQCDELVIVDLSYCNKLKKLPRIIGSLKNVKTLLLKGCKLGESRIEIRDQKFFTISLPRSLVRLSLEDNNLSTESFPMDFSSLSMLKELCLDSNRIVSLPNCVRSLPRLEKLSMVNCNMLMSVENPPHTLTYLDLKCYMESSLQKVLFDPKMSQLDFSIIQRPPPSLFEIEGMVKVQPLADVEENLLVGLGWTNPDFLIGRRVKTSYYDGLEESEIQMYYEFGIFSTIYGGEDMPHWITNRNNGPSITFTIPSSPNNFTGLNFCCVVTSCYAFNSGGRVETSSFPTVSYGRLFLPVIIINNITKNLTWIYHHCIDNFYEGCLTLLSYWMFAMNEMECGDQVTITVRNFYYDMDKVVTKECGVSFMYNDGDTDEEEDVLGYKKSWNHIIGGDLTAFQSTTGEYILSRTRMEYRGVSLHGLGFGLYCGQGARFKEKFKFRAFSQRASCIREDTP
ncbi:hypothetical protein L2E82_29614 [Cichorium intybus]|uniref:Uncharacterized protein n=1 Tax=Cichorium intybus TaxID=13427 RepID=A0ACB9CY41_CICIN|nr:hypothetical protein L2E82_29614 [Cichorium intybus]